MSQGHQYVHEVDRNLGLAAYLPTPKYSHCDGAQGSCSTCSRLGVHCRYKAHLAPKPDQKKLYIKALEDRVAELETVLSGQGHASIGNDHWRQAQNQLQVISPAPEIQHMDDVQQITEIEISPDPADDSSQVPGSKYVGGVSTITLGRVLGSVISSQKSPKSDTPIDEDPNSNPITVAELVETRGQMFITPSVATRLLDGWMKHLSTRYPVIHTPRLRELHARRDEALDIYEESLLHLVYANSGHVLETTGETGEFFTSQHYEAALKHMDAILELRDLRSVTYLLLMALYCLRAPKDPGAWTLAGLAVRLCIELGLHRRSSRNKISLKQELEKRTFWSCYYLDRELSVALGRPPAIYDSDMDAEFPIDVNEDVDDVVTLVQAAQNTQPTSPTSLTSFIYFMRLRRIESKIQNTFYRVDRPTETSPVIIQGFLDELSAWKRAIPPEYIDRKDTKYDPFDGIDVFMILYHKCVRCLLFPQLSEPLLNLQYVKLCAEACAGVCETYKRLYRTLKPGYNPLSLQSVFLAGLTLIYCTWLAPRNFLEVSGAISDCNVMLYVMAERWPAAGKYRDVFEQLKSIITQVNQQAVREAIVLESNLIEWCRGLAQSMTGAVRTDFVRMINDITAVRTRIRTEEALDIPTEPGRRLGEFPEQEADSRMGMWPRDMGQKVDCYDSQFMNNFEDFEVLGPGWESAMLEGTGIHDYFNI
ncbi:hypothetical protein BP5796_12373 [Coleophoma crateriformis]|uniref:Xylanolytic transcriptional activator regulatory domain-containing protein n=1 Tax=Coleophoma crateriformis TaxID=565419 RepID=A0A3D8Q9C2_9HELO|nr:hypothetical protein BP5796_12373 [Coleophoma crateriformis]